MNSKWSSEMTHSILLKLGGTWMEMLQADKEESAQQVVDQWIKNGREAQWVRIGEAATLEAQADLDYADKVQREASERYLDDMIAQITRADLEYANRYGENSGRHQI